jgi:hypothetical protein
MAKQPKFTKDGLPDGRGSSEGSKQTQFASGDGRPRPGRPKGSKSLASIYNETAEASVILVQDGKKKRVSRKEAIVRQEAQQATKGDARARESYLGRLREFNPPEVQASAIDRLLEEDAEILAQAFARGLLASGPSSDVSDGTGSEE